MTIYAVMKTGGKEYRVAPGDVVRVEKLAAAPGTTVEIREVSLIAIGQEVTVGSPTIADARVVAEVVEEGRGERIVSFKKKRRNHYQMTMSDLQSYTVLRIREIAVGKSVYAAAAPRGNVAATVTPPPPPPRISKPERKVPAPQAKKPQQPSTSPPPAPIEVPPPVAAQDDAPVAQPSSDAVHSVHAVESPSAPSSTETPPAQVAVLPRVETAPPTPAFDEREPRKRSYGIDAPVAPKVASEERVGTPSQGAQPTSDVLHPVHAVESPPSALSSIETPPARMTALPRVETARPTPALDEREPRKRSYGIAALLVAVLVIAAGLLVWGGRQPGPAEAATVAGSPQAVLPSVPQPAAKAPPRKETAIKNPAAASAPSAPVQPPE